MLKVGNAGEWDELRAFIATILPTKNGYEMWYSGLKTNLAEGQWIGYAESEDGINWSKLPENPIINTCPVWGKFGYLTGSVLKFDGYYHMWYTSFDMYGDRGRFGYAISDTSSPVHVQIDNYNIPENFSLSQNYPNPFNQKTTISYQLPVNSFVELSIYSVLGQKIQTLVSERKQSGIHKFEWDASGLTSGVYFYQLMAGTNIETKKLILLR
ncbi:T9SS type A sorting domain-containing protein [candidate division KSB1 bacterium]|nr:T9SS type A sorting domain-containing protein [candidate division KSB1 bacterium]